MKEKEYSLGVKSGEGNNPMPISSDKAAEEYFPSLHIDNAPVEFPKEGMMMVKFKRTRHVVNDKNKSMECALEIISVSHIKDTSECEECMTGHDKRGAALDKLKGDYDEE